MSTTRNLAHRVLETIDGFTIIETSRCSICNETGSIAFTADQIADLEAGAFIQDAAADLPRPVREQFISGIHGACWDAMFGPTPE